MRPYQLKQSRYFSIFNVRKLSSVLLGILTEQAAILLNRLVPSKIFRLWYGYLRDPLVRLGIIAVHG